MDCIYFYLWVPQYSAGPWKWPYSCYYYVLYYVSSFFVGIIFECGLLSLL